MKYLFDWVVSLTLLLVLSPVILILSILIRLKLGSPVLFTQQRPGLHGKPFVIYKFRSMTNQTDQSGQLLPDEERLTSFGKFLRKYSLDELPQLFNVINGDLSLVGPRPLLMEYLPLYSPEQARRHEVKPGITGWAQVNGRNAISWEEKFRLDVWYVDNRTFSLDLKIIWITFIKVLQSAGVNQEGHVTSETFTGTECSKASGRDSGGLDRSVGT